MEQQRVRVGIVGPTGYAGMELVRLLAQHPYMDITYLAGSGAHTGPIGDALPHLRRLSKLPPVSAFSANACAESCDLAFVALPSGESGSIAVELAQRGVRAIDLSGDLRLPGDVYRTWYQREPVADDVLARAVYGLPELNRADVSAASLVANPGCYATAAILALRPLVDWVKSKRVGPVVIDAKSGATGAGRAAKQNLQLGELANDFYPYRVGAHQHTPEIEQGLDGVFQILLTTQLLPIPRGIFVSAYVSLDPDLAADIHARYASFYESAPFVDVLPPGHVPHIKSVAGTNDCQVSVAWNERTGILQVFSAIDNLGKGAAGQALQNANLMCGFDETTGLTETSLWT
ncbi:N-acetyl-gamma-glutamyl-phosphate reductase [Alicyclobacillus hesperidum]|uniref:N-acetyl-gamma-glutamyl-phosphate reductase n=1 Tax=Alicyclobacillus hesperidum TaxID=89784 RepID=A0A1H2XFE1_9BACL|nr:N-acetyl-gamma-glutamyl-phosphate reductase [Alicyclobacillus hesperidum]SDW91501.1 N-acetyl-gamma-glutamyl-phosphate reductase [Alicyclobacillus hesperidum]